MVLYKLKNKIVAFWSYYENFAKNNLIFSNKCEWNNKLFYKYQVLKEILNKNHLNILPLNKADISDVVAVIFYDIPDNINSLISNINSLKNIKKFLIVEECKDLRPLNWNPEIHKMFDTIFTWSNELISQNKKYKKIFLTNLNKNSNHYKNISYNDKKIILLNSNKYLNSKNELYSLRRKIIEYAQIHNINKFKLYGNDWNRNTFKMNKWYSFLNSKRFNFLFKTEKYKNIYKGRADDKDEIMSEFDFAFCFENIKNTEDYVTEKITDAMISGSIPIYYGCPNIYDYFPKNTFINFEEFNSIDDCFSYLKNMSKKSVLNYKYNIKEFLESNESNIFTGDHFAKTISDEILSINDLSV